MKYFLSFCFIFLISHMSADDSSTLREISLKLEQAKKFLAIWDKNKENEENLIKAIDTLKLAKDQSKDIKDQEADEYAELNREISMLYFWANKSKRVLVVHKKKDDFVKYQKTAEEEANDSTDKIEDKTVASVSEVKIENEGETEKINIPDDHPVITAAFRKAIEYSKSNPGHLFEIEFMYRDIYFDFPTSRSAEIATNLANNFSQKIDAQMNDKKIVTKSIRDSIPQFEQNYNKKALGKIVNDLLALKNSEKDKVKREYIREMIVEYKYMQSAIDALGELIKINKSNYAPSSILGITFRGEIINANEKGIEIKTEMGSMITPWTKVSDEQIGKLLGYLTKGQKEVSYKIAIAMHLFGNSVDAFELLYEKAIENPIILAKHSEYYFQTLYHYRKVMKSYIESEIERSRKMHDNKNPKEAINILTKCLLKINKNNYLRDQIKSIHSIIVEFSK